MQAYLASAKVSAHDSTLKKGLDKNGISGRVARRKPWLTKSNSSASFTFAKKYIMSGIKQIQNFTIRT
uniref:Transposase Tc1-like domain-containing protein n=1 Tax=Anguilla anguilla TaxID=7936 RepID=A0A0E9WF26_ANGAN